MRTEPLILFLDAYDSFSNNIIALLESECHAKVIRLFIDASVPDFESYLQNFSAVVCGPGPGNPSVPDDVGLFKKIWALPNDKAIPALGICLGFQSLAHDFGAAIERLPHPRHGIKTTVTSISNSIFEGLPSFGCVQYHSLQAVLSGFRSSEATADQLWKPHPHCPQLQPLAWDMHLQSLEGQDAPKMPLPILMSIKHTHQPFYGIQFHPESICSDPRVKRVISNWWRTTLNWWAKPILTEDGNLTPAGRLRNQYSINHMNNSENRFCLSKSPESAQSPLYTARLPFKEKVSVRVFSHNFGLGTLKVPAICEALNLPSHEFIVLDSECRQVPHLGETSIIGVLNSRTKQIQYSVSEPKVTIRTGSETSTISLVNFDNNVFSFLKSLMSTFNLIPDAECVFSGGLVGYISYEACLETIGVRPVTPTKHPSLNFAFIEQSIVISHRTNTVSVQTLQYEGENDSKRIDWVESTTQILKDLSERPEDPSGNHPVTLKESVRSKAVPCESLYKSKIAYCQDKILEGESYELCLTDQTSIKLKNNTTSWNIYKSLRQTNPAPFGAYLRLGPLTLLSTSPERFMTWSNFKNVGEDCKDGCSNEQVSTCQFRPMKGTVRKLQHLPDGSTRQVSRAEATAILSSEKERAENLMILDLIRHDLQGVCRSVSVPDLMRVEEYASVYQLVSVIEGKIYKPLQQGPFDNVSGLDCLAASLPPGSMTGAPKKRSCEILESIEDGPRSVYSGVLGYIDIGGRGDFSVLIRIMYSWNDGEKGEPTDWNIGAGGAVTALSTEDGEWQEMLTKLQSTLRIFET